MADYQLISPGHPLLTPYIDHYMVVSGEEVIPSKQILPRPGVSLVFDFQASFYFGKNQFQKALSGFQHQPFTYTTGAERADHFVVQFSPYGLSRFTTVPQHEFTGKIIEPGLIFGEDILDIYEQMENTDSVHQRIKFVEGFLLKRFSAPLQIDMAIFGIADQLRDELSSAGIRTAKKQASLSPRQIERKFKATIGVDMQSFIRISRFARAKKLLLQNPSLRLTDIGLETGYYDQPHFSNDFRRMSGVHPGRFEHCMKP